MADGFMLMMQPVFPRIDVAETPASDLPSSLNANSEKDIHTSVLIVIMGLLLFFLFYFLIDGFHNLLQNERYEGDIELGEMNNQHERSRTTISAVDWSHQAAAIHRQNIWVLETLNRIVQALDDRRGLGREEMEKVLPIVNYNSNEMKRSDDCAICLEDFQDEDLCRIFPVCNHVFHWNCIDGWVKNNLTCPVCRNCILDLDLDDFDSS
ncbi:hypothetical protein SLA2020_396120 [Shorea laevis]